MDVRLLGEVSDPDGRSVVLIETIWEGKIARDHPELSDELDNVLGTVSAPDHTEPDPRPDRRRYLPPRSRPQSVADGGRKL
jgi:hypothetical protein